MKKILAGTAAAMALAVGLSACAAPPSENSASQAATGGATAVGGGSFKACMVSDSGGFDDKSFNETSYNGLKKAKSDLGIATNQIESSNANDFASNIQAMIDDKCTAIVTVGFLLGDATVAAAKAHPEINFAIVDDTPKGSEGLKNLKPLVFNTAESSFLAGYFAAANTKSGKVGTFGGMKIPTVTIFMDGFAQGVKYYNEKKGKSVQLLGWNEAKQDGQFVPEPNPFDNAAGAKTVAQNLVNQGADIILPVAGPAGLGGLDVAKASGGKANAIWVDTDGCVSASQYCSSIMTSVYKGMDVAVFDAIKAAKDGKFDATAYVGTLENDGTGISPFHDFDSKVPADVKSELDQVKKDIVSGSIKITSAAQPKKS